MGLAADDGEEDANGAGGLALTVSPFPQRGRTQAQGASKSLAAQSNSLARGLEVGRFHGNAREARRGRPIAPGVGEGFLQSHPHD